jgi:tetratricopeptide (TPR) repeat protein
MTYRRSALLFLTTALLLFGVSGSAAANEGGGGGSFELPSASAPRYDPTKDYQAGAAALQANNFDEADRAFGRVLRAMPRDVNTLVLSGMAKAGKNDLRGARGQFERALRQNAQHVVARREFAITLAKLGDRDKASAELDTLKQRITTCAETCAESADLKAAVAAVEQALATPGTSSSLAPPGLLFAAQSGDSAYLEAIARVNEKRYQDALASLREAQAAFGPHPDILTYTGFTHRKLGDFTTAESYYRQALAIAPEHRGALEYYGELKIERGDVAGAKLMLARLESVCAFGCAEAEELRRWIDAAR